MGPTFVYRDAFNGYAAKLTKSALAKVSSDPSTLSVQLDAEISSAPEKGTELPPQQPQFVTNGVKRIGGLQSPTAKIDGIDERIDVDVAVIDDGVDPAHPDLNIAGIFNCSTSSANGTETSAARNHGTLVAGFVGAIDNEFGAVGAAPGARIWGIRTANSNGILTKSSVLCALDWVAAHVDVIDVVNMSFGDAHVVAKDCVRPGRPGERKGQRDLVHEAICRLDNAGVTLVASAGNEATDKPLYPAAYEEVIAVSGIGDSDGAPGQLGPDLALVCSLVLPGEQLDDHFAFFSNYGPWVDISAPAVCISSTYPGGRYATSIGTSFASPLVAGAAALYLHNHPDATPAEVRTALLANAEPGPIPGDPDAYPESIVNVATL